MQLIQSIKHFALSAAMGAVTLGTVPWAAGDVITFTGAVNNLWSVSDNWSSSTVPTEADRVVIPQGLTCEVDVNAEADTIVVEEGGVLSISAGKTLTLDNDDPHGEEDPNHSIIDGRVVLQGEDSVLYFAENDHTLMGEGAIWGHHSLARIDIDPDVVLRNDLAETGQGIRGYLTIKGLTGGTSNGTFANFGIVHAGRFSVTTGTLEIHADTVVEDAPTTGQAQWMVEYKGPVLLFSASATTLNGDFRTIACGKLYIDANVKTCGMLDMDRYLVVASGTWFAYVTFYGNCANPGTPGIEDPPSCSNPYVISGLEELRCGITACP